MRYVLLHGLGSSPQLWSATKTRLLTEHTKGADVLAPHLVMDGGIEQEAARVAAAMAVPSDPAVVVGHSMGGLVATSLATDFPELVERLVLVNSPTSVASRTGARGRAESLLAGPRTGPALWRMMGRRGARKGLASAVAPGAEVPGFMVDDLLRTGWETWSASTAAIDAYLDPGPLADRLGGLAAPVSVLFGTADRRVDPSTALAEYRSVEGVSVHPMSYTGHTPPVENSLATFRAILSDDAIAEYLREDA